MAGNSNSGGPRKNAGRKSNAKKLLDAGFVAHWFTHEFQEIKWKNFLNSEDEKVQLDSMKYITDRIHGKAAQAVDMNLAGKDGGPIQASIAVTFVKTNAGKGEVDDQP